MAHAKDDHVIAMDKVLKAIREDLAGFKNDPMGKVPELDPKAANEFGKMKPDELKGLTQADDNMKKVGYAVSGGGVSVRMV